MTTKTEVCNLAISHLGTAKEMSDVDTERSQEARACKRFYDTARKKVLAARDWNFATKLSVVGLVEEDPNDEWSYSFRYPNDCVFFRRIISGMRQDTRVSRVPFKFGRDSSGILIYTDDPYGNCEYTEDVEELSFWSEEAIMALSYYLAFLVAPRITGGDPFKMRKEMYDLYKSELSEASGKDLEEEGPDMELESPTIKARY